MRRQFQTLALMLSVASLSVAAEEQWVSLEKTGGEALFREKCGMCHGDAMGMGTGLLARRMAAEAALLENRDDLQASFIENVVRNGFGVMFPMSRGEVGDKQLQAIIGYLAAED